MFKNTCSLCGLVCNRDCGVCEYCFTSLAILSLPEQGNLLHRPDIAKLYPKLKADALFACSWYQAPVSTWLTNYKYHQQRYLLKSLWQLIEAQLADATQLSAFEKPDIFTFVPSHSLKLVSRGFNQVCQIWQKPLKQATMLTLFERDKKASVQANLKRQARLKNLQHAFSLKPNIASRIHGKHIVILDDVITTGATLDVLTNLLKQAGAARVDVWVVCITPLAS